MLQCATTFVLGAGFSAELKLPLGAELATLMSPMLNIRFGPSGKISGDDDIISALKRFTKKDPRNPVDFNVVRQVCVQLSEGLSQAESIDTFLNSHSDNKYMVAASKIAIAHVILAKERSSLVFGRLNNGSRAIDHVALKGKGIAKLAELIFSNVPNGKFEEALSKVSIINFNYDRCVEHYLTHWMMSYFGISSLAAEGAISELNIVHPYGSIGLLSRQHEVSNASTDFGEAPDSAALLQMSERVRTFGEQIEDLSAIERIKKIVSATEQLIFLGFAYHEQNIRLLAVDDFHSIKRIFGTAYKMSAHNLDVVKKEIRTALKLKDRVSITMSENWQCGDLFDNVSRVLRAQ